MRAEPELSSPAQERSRGGLQERHPVAPDRSTPGDSGLFRAPATCPGDQTYQQDHQGLGHLRRRCGCWKTLALAWREGRTTGTLVCSHEALLGPQRTWTVASEYVAIWLPARSFSFPNLLSWFYFLVPKHPFLKKFIYFIYLFWLCWVFVAAHRLSLATGSRGYSSLRCEAFSLQWLLLLWSRGSRRVGFSSCGMRAQ